MIDQSTIDRIMDAARIEEVVGEFVTLRKRGVNYTGLCPFHDEKTPSFSVSPARGICKCFSCGKGGNVVHFIMEHEQLNYYDALKWLAKKYHIEIIEKVRTPEELQKQNDRESLFILNEFARDYFSRILHEHADGKSIALGYFKERGFREDVIRKFQLGFSLDQKDGFTKEAIAKGYQTTFLLKTGLSLNTEKGDLFDRYRNRVIFPVHTISGKVVAFGGRILKSKDEKIAKYINSPESEIYHKSNELYGLYFAKQAIAKQDKCFLVEGYTDVISMHQAGIENVVSSSGTALTHGQIRLIHRFTKNVTVLYDGDSAGIKASLKGINLLLEEGLNIKVLLLPDGEDPDSFSKKRSATDFIQYLKENETDFIRFKTEILLTDAGKDPIKRVQLIQDLVDSIALIGDDITRSVYIRETSRLLDFDESLLLQQVNKKKFAHLPQASFPRYQVPQQANNVSPKSKETATETNNFPLDDFERNILKMVIRYGNNTLCQIEQEDGNHQQVSVIEFIKKNLDEDQITLQNPVYKSIWEMAIEHATQKGFDSKRLFLNHQNPEISMLAADLIDEPYELSKYHSRFQEIDQDEDKLFELVPRILEDLKFAIVRTELKQLEIALKEAQKSKNEDELVRITREMLDLQEIQRNLGKRLGERIVIR